MAEEQFTSRRARREAERLAADQAFEAREAPEQPSEPTSHGQAEPLNPSSESAEGSSESVEDTNPRPSAPEDEPGDFEPVSADEDTSHVDAQQEPLPHFDSRTARKNYLREHGLSLEGDVSTGAIPVVAGPEEASDEESDESLSDESLSPADESFDTAGFGGSADEVAARDFESPVTADSAPRPAALNDDSQDALSRPIETLDSEDASPVAEDAPLDSEDASSDTEDTVPDSADALLAPTRPDTVSDSVAAPELADGHSQTPGEQAVGDKEATVSQPADNPVTVGEYIDDQGNQPTGADEESPNEEPAPRTRSRRMPIVQPSSTSGVRVVTAASAQIPQVEGPETNADAGESTTNSRDPGMGQHETMSTPADSSAPDVDRGDPTAPDVDRGDPTAPDVDRGDPTAPDVDHSDPTAPDVDSAESATSSDDAARALAANPETRPMETVPEAWALPNPDYEDEETENPPGTRIRASAVTGHDGRILVGEEPSKVPFVVLGVAALFAVALIVIALVMLL